MLADCLPIIISEYILGEGIGYCNHLETVFFAKVLGMFQNRSLPSSEGVTISNALIPDQETNVRLMVYLQ